MQMRDHRERHTGREKRETGMDEPQKSRKKRMETSLIYKWEFCPF